MKKIILLGGRTGGPIIPLLAIAKNILIDEIVIFGIREGFEQEIALQKGYSFYSFPEAKLKIFSQSNQTIKEIIINGFDLVATGFKLIFSFTKSIILLSILRPSAIVSTGSFVAVPVLYACWILTKLHCIKTKIIIHQQDPDIGLSNKLTARLADILTCTYQKSKNSKEFSNSQIIPNPFDFDSISDRTIAETSKTQTPKLQELMRFIKHKKLPLLLIFGGGSGSSFINNWVYKYHKELTRSFCLIHLTGGYEQASTIPQSTEYYTTPTLIDEMKVALYYSDVVISRCGLGSITELTYLNKPAFLVPIPHSHQESNAKEVKDVFYILTQDQSEKWINQINEIYPKWFKTHNHTPIKHYKNELEKYYSRINSIIKD